MPTWSPRVPCHIGQCPHPIEASVDGVKKHLHHYHSYVFSPPSGGSGKVNCLWYDDKSCLTELEPNGITKHIAVVHLKLKTQECPYPGCSSVLSRGDALLRHLRRDCKVIPPEDRARLEAQRE